MTAVFNVQKFLEFEMGDYSNIEACVKCAAAYALGTKVSHTFDAIITYLDLSSTMGRNWFEKTVSKEFSLEMDEAENMLRRKVSPEVIKKFVIDAAIKAGLVEGVTNACKEESKACA